MKNLFFEYYNYFILLIIPLSIIFGISLFKKRHIYRIKKSKEILKKIKSFKGDNYEVRIINYLRKIDPFTFEELLLNLFEDSGCKITRNKKYTGDGGIDGKFKFKNKNYFIQAKRYSNYIKQSDIQNFANICRFNKVYGLFIHTGKTGKSMKSILENNIHIIVISPTELVDFIINGRIKISN